MRDLDLRVLRGDRWASSGPMAPAKPTLLKLLTGQDAPDAGNVQLGTNLQW